MGIQADGSIDKCKRYSPAAALAAARREGFSTSICAATFYSYIKKGVFLHLSKKDLWKNPQGKRNYETVQRNAHPLLPNIADRPERINLRQEAGHWEMDLIVGKAKTSACILTLYNRKTREFMLFKLPDKRAVSVRTVFDRLERSMGKTAFRERFKSITTDNGSEFLEYELLVKSVYGGERFKIWYCHPYSAWGGEVECYNRMAEWLPEIFSFTRITKKRIAEFQTWINGYPRKIWDGGRREKRRRNTKQAELRPGRRPGLCYTSWEAEWRMTHFITKWWTTRARTAASTVKGSSRRKRMGSMPRTNSITLITSSTVKQDKDADEGAPAEESNPIHHRHHRREEAARYDPQSR